MGHMDNIEAGIENTEEFMEELFQKSIDFEILDASQFTSGGAESDAVLIEGVPLASGSRGFGGSW